MAFDRRLRLAAFGIACRQDHGRAPTYCAPFGALTAVLPTNEKAPSYNVNLVGPTYVYHWQ